MNAKEMVYGVIAEAAFYGFIYYASYLLKVEGNLLWSSFVLWALMNIAIVMCPVVRKSCTCF